MSTDESILGESWTLPVDTNGDYNLLIFRVVENHQHGKRVSDIRSKMIAVPTDVKDVDAYIEEKEPGWKLGACTCRPCNTSNGELLLVNVGGVSTDEVRKYIKHAQEVDLNE